MSATDRITLVLATNNPHKAREFQAMLRVGFSRGERHKPSDQRERSLLSTLQQSALRSSNLPIMVVPLGEIAPGVHVVEDGNTFEENAIKKATVAAQATGMLTLADDSGLEVDVLGGLPGVRSARFAHEHATDAENNAHLLHMVKPIEDPSPKARFRCVLALINPGTPHPLPFPPYSGARELNRLFHPVLAEGVCEGSITRSARGVGGFGYDPLFVVDGMGGRTMAELSDVEKNAVSHRGQALHRLLPELKRIAFALSIL